jgi:regulator of RNase E activity RraB
MGPKLERQRNETFEVFNDIASKYPIPEMAVVDFHMIPSAPNADWEQMATHARARGFTVELYDHENVPTMEIRTRPLTLSAEVIWEYEERLTLLARQYGFKPDGWGFFGVSMDEDFGGV